MMQIKRLPIPQYVYPVPSQGNVFVVQRLMQVTDKVDDKLGGLSATPGGERRVQRLLGVVGQGGDDASIGFAIALEVDIARVRWAVVRVNEVEVLGEPAPFCVADGIGPRGYFG